MNSLLSLDHIDRKVVQMMIEQWPERPFYIAAYLLAIGYRKADIMDALRACGHIKPPPPPTEKQLAGLRYHTMVRSQV